jgi:hypothetical protein
MAFKGIENCLDDRHQIYFIYKSVCTHCKYFEYKYYSCEAFPNGIPNNILSGESNHLTPTKNQNNTIVYKAKTGSGTDQ